MKKSILLIIFFSLVLINGVLASEYSSCIKSCIINTKNNINDCHSEFDICSENARVQLKDCSHYSGKNKTACMKDARNEIIECNADKKVCLKDIDNSVSRCKKKCSYTGKNITCEKGKYNAGDVFLNQCDKCECNGNGKVSCKTTEFCNFASSNISKETCESNGGLFQKLCAGSIMSSKCTKEFYCQCGGKFNFGCENGSICLYDFYLNKNRKGQFSQEWIEYPDYRKIGNIGICVKKLQLTYCGNGICENICDDDNCSLAETSYNCIEDCK